MSSSSSSEVQHVSSCCCFCRRSSYFFILFRARKRMKKFVEINWKTFESVRHIQMTNDGERHTAVAAVDRKGRFARNESSFRDRISDLVSEKKPIQTHRFLRLPVGDAMSFRPLSERIGRLHRGGHRAPDVAENEKKKRKR